MICKVVNVLLIEGKRSDQMEVARILEHAGILNRMSIASNENEALRFLDNLQKNSLSEKPDVILVDLNLPRLDCFKFISTLKNQESLQDTKVFALADSQDEMAKVRALRSGVSGIIDKPMRRENVSTGQAFNIMIDMMNMRSNQ